MWFYLIFSKTLQGREYRNVWVWRLLCFSGGDIWVMLTKMIAEGWSLQTVVTGPPLGKLPYMWVFAYKTRQTSPRKDPPALTCQPRCHRQCTWPRSKGAIALHRTWGPCRGTRPETSACLARLPILLEACWGAVQAPKSETWEVFSWAHPQPPPSVTAFLAHRHLPHPPVSSELWGRLHLPALNPIS